MNQQYVHLLVLLIVAGSSFFGWLVRVLKEQAAKKRAQEAIEKQKLETLRTGPRSGDTVSASTQATLEAPTADPLQEAARRRREQIERARAAARASTPTPAPSAPQPSSSSDDLTIRLPNGVVLKLPGNAPPTPAPPAPAPSAPRVQPRPDTRSQPQIAKKPAPARTRQPARPVRSSNAPPGDPPPQLGRLGTRPTETIEIPAELAPISAITAISAVAAPPAIRPAVIDPRSMTPADWRRAFITNEVLREPMSLRTEDQQSDLF